MQRKKTSRKISKKAAKKPTRRVSKKTARKPVAKAAKKSTQRASKKTPAEPTGQLATSESENQSRKSRPKHAKRPILVPLDFSVHSEAALGFAADMAECLDSPVVVLHVVHDPGDAPGYYRVKGRKKQLNRLEDVAKDMLNNFMAKMIKQQSKRTVLKQAKRLLVIGLPATRILEVAEKLEPTMVVMGSAGRTGLSHFLLGSKAEHLVRICPFPVTIVKAPAKKGKR